MEVNRVKDPLKVLIGVTLLILSTYLFVRHFGIFTKKIREATFAHGMWLMVREMLIGLSGVYIFMFIIGVVLTFY